jgi:Fe2+ or Zn2+ uptake regulation protein
MITKLAARQISCQRITCQRETILDYLKSVKTHPTADKVYFKVKKKLPRISRGTVYRILKNFKEAGQAQEISVKGIAHFDANISPHAHFICQNCGKISDIFENICGNCKVLKNKKTKVGKIENYKINFYGYCKNCQK